MVDEWSAMSRVCVVEPGGELTVALKAKLMSFASGRNNRSGNPGWLHSFKFNGGPFKYSALNLQPLLLLSKSFKLSTLETHQYYYATLA